MSYHPASRLMHSQSPAQAMINGRIDGAVSIRAIQKSESLARSNLGMVRQRYVVYLCLPYRHDQTCNAGHAILTQGDFTNSLLPRLGILNS